MNEPVRGAMVLTILVALELLVQGCSLLCFGPRSAVRPTGLGEAAHGLTRLPG